MFLCIFLTFSLYAAGKCAKGEISDDLKTECCSLLAPLEHDVEKAVFIGLAAAGAALFIVAAICLYCLCRSNGRWRCLKNEE